MANPWKIFKMVIWFVILAALAWSFTNCAPQKRLYRFQKKHPYLFEKQIDTIVVRDTVRITIPGSALDTAFSIDNLRTDTVSLVEDRLKVQVYIRNDTVFVSGQCDTIYKVIPIEKKVPVTKYNVEGRKNDYKSLIFLAISLAIIYLLAKYLDLKLDASEREQKEENINE